MPVPVEPASITADRGRCEASRIPDRPSTTCLASAAQDSSCPTTSERSRHVRASSSTAHAEQPDCGSRPTRGRTQSPPSRTVHVAHWSNRHLPSSGWEQPSFSDGAKAAARTVDSGMVTEWKADKRRAFSRSADTTSGLPGRGRASTRTAPESSADVRSCSSSSSQARAGTTTTKGVWRQSATRRASSRTSDSPGSG